jgi:hypothetical protein
MLRMHFVTAVTAGPIKSAPGPALPPEVAGRLGRATIADGGTLAVACDPGIQLSHEDRATGCWWLVACPRCKATAAFQTAAATIPNPRAVAPPGAPEFET